MVRRILTIFIFMACILASVTVGAGQTLRLATPYWKPYANISNREAPGFSTEVIDRVMTSLGVRIILEEYPWKRALQFVYAGRCDGLYSAFYTPERAKQCIYPSEALNTVRHVMVIRKADKERLKYRSPEDVKGFRVGLIRGGHYPRIFMETLEREGEIDWSRDSRISLMKLIKHRVDFIVGESHTTPIEGRDMGIMDEIMMLDEVVIQEKPHYLIFSKKTVSPRFVRSFDRALKTFKQTQGYLDLKKKYFIPM